MQLTILWRKFMQKNEPTFSGVRVLKEAEDFFNRFVEAYEGKEPEEITLALLREICTIKASQLQLVEAFETNWYKSNGAFENSHLAVTKYQELDGTMKSQGRNFSERLERLERRFG